MTSACLERLSDLVNRVPDGSVSFWIDRAPRLLKDFWYNGVPTDIEECETVVRLFLLERRIAQLEVMIGDV